MECGKISIEKNLLRAPNPFDEGDFIIGCPFCKAACDFYEICYEPGCEMVATYGFVAEDGEYRRTCLRHSIRRSKHKKEDAKK